MRAALFLLLMLPGACARPELQAPSLAPRAAEAIDPRAPVAEAAIITEASPALVRQLDELVGLALAGDAAFRPAADNAERLASAAGPPQSESWVVAQQALSAAVAARAPVTRALGEIDSLSAARIQQLGGMSAGDLAAIESASVQVAQIDAREAALLDRIQARLGG